MLFSIILFSFIIGICYLSPVRGLVALLNINLLRNLKSITLVDPCLKCVAEQDILLGGVLQALGLLIILLKTNLLKNPTYKLDYIDIFLILTLILLIISSCLSIAPTDGLFYTIQYLLLGIPYFFITKVVFINVGDFQKALTKMLSFSVNFAVIFGLIAALVVAISGYKEPYAAYGVVMRLTIQGVHPIPFAQAMGFGFLSSIYLIITRIKNKEATKTLFIKSVFLLVIIFLSNTRGIVVSLAFAGVIAATLYFRKPKFNKNLIRISFAALLLLFTVLFFFIDVEAMFGRFYSDKLAFESILLRFESIFESIRIFKENFFIGIGPTAFPLYSNLPYPHNFFLEHLAFFGVWGLLLCIGYIIFVLEIVILTKKNSKRPLYVFILTIFLFYFIEAQVSFTLWTHKGVYFSLGLLMSFYVQNQQNTGSNEN
jgi:hypothetical protein